MRNAKHLDGSPLCEPIAVSLKPGELGSFCLRCDQRVMFDAPGEIRTVNEHFGKNTGRAPT